MKPCGFCFQKLSHFGDVQTLLAKRFPDRSISQCVCPEPKRFFQNGLQNKMRIHTGNHKGLPSAVTAVWVITSTSYVHTTSNCDDLRIWGRDITLNPSRPDSLLRSKASQPHHRVPFQPPTLRPFAHWKKMRSLKKTLCEKDRLTECTNIKQMRCECLIVEKWCSHLLFFLNIHVSSSFQKLAHNIYVSP